MRLHTILFLAGLTLPIHTFADNIGSIYGRANASIDYVNNTSGKPISRVSSNTSRIGFKGKTTINDNIDAIWQVETQIQIDDGRLGTFASRNSYVGIKSNFITIKLGKHDTPYKLLAYKIPQILGGSIGDIAGFSGIYHRIDQRPSNTLLIQSNIGDAEFGYMYATKEENNNNGYLHSAGINYGTNKAAIQLGMQQNINSTYNLDNLPNNRVLAKTVSAYYEIKNTKIGVGYEHIRDKINIIDRMMILTRRISDNKTIEIIYAQSNERSQTQGYGKAYEVELAYEYTLSQRTSLKYGAGIIQNKNTNINFGANWLPPPLPLGSDLRFVTAGIAHSF